MRSTARVCWWTAMTSDRPPGSSSQDWTVNRDSWSKWARTHAVTRAAFQKCLVKPWHFPELFPASKISGNVRVSPLTKVYILTRVIVKGLHSTPIGKISGKIPGERVVRSTQAPPLALMFQKCPWPRQVSCSSYVNGTPTFLDILWCLSEKMLKFVQLDF